MAEVEDPGRARTEPAARGAGAAAPPPGARIGRFVVGEVLGEGGMGVVVSAHDPDLDRDVAIKLVRGVPGADGAEGRARLLREARAMARLRHPNVLTVYEAGTHDGDVYVVMERVGGGTLRDALRRAAGASWQEIVRLFVAAGEGLAAAHGAGMVHRDFKPDNVLCEGTRVLVADFGLVGAATGEPPPSSKSGSADAVAPPVDETPLTRVGAVVGTPAYMAPEQHRGDPLDARSDQFAFCTALYEALYDVLPFRGRTRGQLVRAIERGAPRPPRSNRDVPSWIHDAVMRGLGADPARRHASMRALIDELSADPTRARPGARNRTLGLVAFSLAVVAWAGVSSVIDYRLSYRAMGIIDAGCLALVALIAVTQRRALSDFNRRVLGVGVGAILATLAMLVGARLAGFPASAAALLHLFTVFCFAVAASVLLERRLWPTAAAYLAAFLVSAIDHDLFFPASFASHGLMAVVLFVVLGARAGARRP